MNRDDLLSESVSDNIENLDRRQLFRTLGTVSLLGAVGGLGARSEAVQAQQTSGAGDFAKPPGLKPGAQLDSRFPVSFATTVSEGLRLVVAYFTALNQHNINAEDKFSPDRHHNHQLA